MSEMSTYEVIEHIGRTHQLHKIGKKIRKNPNPTEGQWQIFHYAQFVALAFAPRQSVFRARKIRFTLNDL